VKKLFVILSTVFLLVVSTTALAAQEFEKPKLFVREGCSHCAKVKTFLEKYELTDQVEILEAAGDEVPEQLETRIKTISLVEPPAKLSVSAILLTESGDEALCEESAKVSCNPQ